MVLAARASGSVSLVAVTDFQELLNRIAKGFPTRTALAKAIDINASRLSRALNGTDQLPFNIENCLQLAKVSGEPASNVLRAADKGDIADLIESLYGPQRKVTDPAVLDLLQHWPTFSADERSYIRNSIAMVLRARDSTQAAALKKRGRSTSVLKSDGLRSESEGDDA